MRRVKNEEDMVFPAVRDAIGKKRFRERQQVVFNALVAFVASLVTNIVLDLIWR